MAQCGRTMAKSWRSALYVGGATSSVSFTGSIQAMYVRKLSLTLTHTRGNFEGSCSDYD